MRPQFNPHTSFAFADSTRRPSSEYPLQKEISSQFGTRGVTISYPFNIRYWAVEGLSFLGSDQVVAQLLDVFDDDPSAMIRERAACSLAQSGMRNETQRWRAVPRLLEFTSDGALDAETRGWVFQALRDVTGQWPPPDLWAWKRWYQNRK
jgi:hypothetical protein